MVSAEYDSLVLGDVLCSYHLYLFEEHIDQHPIICLLYTSDAADE